MKVKASRKLTHIVFNYKDLYTELGLALLNPFCAVGVGANWDKETCQCMNCYLKFQVPTVLYPLAKEVGKSLWTSTEQHGV